MTRVAGDGAATVRPASGPRGLAGGVAGDVTGDFALSSPLFTVL
jgi:hypothetical protein